MTNFENFVQKHNVNFNNDQFGNFEYNFQIFYITKNILVTGKTEIIVWHGTNGAYTDIFTSNIDTFNDQDLISKLNEV